MQGYQCSGINAVVSMQGYQYRGINTGVSIQGYHVVVSSIRGKIQLVAYSNWFLKLPCLPLTLRLPTAGMTRIYTEYAPVDHVMHNVWILFSYLMRGDKNIWMLQWSDHSSLRGKQALYVFQVPSFSDNSVAQGHHSRLLEREE